MAKDTTVNPALIDWASREAKRRSDVVMRGFMLPLLLGPSEEIKVASLPAALWLWERDLATMYPDKMFGFHGVERNKDVKAKMKATAKRLNDPDLFHNAAFVAEPHPTWKNFLKKTQDTFDIVYADYMGSWTLNKSQDVETIFERDLLNPGGFFMMTVSLTMRGGGSAEVMRQLAYECGQGVHDIFVIDDRAEYQDMGLARASQDARTRCLGIPKIVMNLAADHGVKLQPQPVHIYYNKYDNNPILYPEVCLCFRRVRE